MRSAKLLPFLFLLCLNACLQGPQSYGEAEAESEMAEAMPVQQANYIPNSSDILIQNDYAIESNYAIDMHFPGVVIGDAQYAPSPDDHWMGFFIKSTHSYVQACDLNLEQGKYTAYDPDMNETDNAYRLSNEGEQPFCYFKGLGIEENQTFHAVQCPARIYPSSPFSFEFEGESYTLSAEANLQKGASFDDTEAMTDYTLFLGKENNPRQAIIYTKFFDSNFFEIIWLGDMDQDKRPDLLLSSSHKYTGSGVTLCLSSLASPGEYLGEAVTVESETGPDDIFMPNPPEEKVHSEAKKLVGILSCQMPERNELKSFQEEAMLIETIKTEFNVINASELACDTLNFDVEEEQYFEEAVYCFQNKLLTKFSQYQGGDHGGQSLEVYFRPNEFSDAADPFFVFRKHSTYPIGSAPIVEEERMYVEDGYLVKMLVDKNGERTRVEDEETLLKKQRALFHAIQGIVRK